MTPTPLGNEVRRARTALSLSLQALSDHSAQFTDDGEPIPVRTIHGVETGETVRPSDRNLRPLAQALGLRFESLALLAYGLDPGKLLVGA
jgi:transcriptional regulator with XRE-family HTH domain